MQINLSKSDVIWSYIGILMSMSVNILLLPIIVYYLDFNMLGLWYIFASIGGIAELFDFGFGVTFARNITYCWSGARSLKKKEVVFVQNNEPDFSLMKRVLLSCKAVYLILSVTVLLLMLTAGISYIHYISKDIEENDYNIAWIIYSISVFLNMYYGFYASFLRGVGAVDWANKNTIIARFFQIVFTIVFLEVGFGLIGVCSANLIYGTIFRLLGKHRFYRYKDIGHKLKNVKDRVSILDALPLFAVVWYNAWREGVISLSNYLSGQACTIICSLFLTLPETGVYAIGVQIAGAIGAISSTFYTAAQPQLQAAYINKNVEKVRETMSLILYSLIVLFVLGVILALVVLLPILKYIKPGSVVSVSVFLGLCLYHLVIRFIGCYVSYFSSTNRLPYIKSFILSSFFCVVIAVILVGYYDLGVWGLISAQLVSQIVFNLWYWPYRALKEINLSLIESFSMGFILIYQKYSLYKNNYFHK